MDLTTAQPVIRDVVADCIGIPTQWEDLPRDFVDPSIGAVCLLSLPTVVPQGHDWRTTKTTPEGDLEVTHHGNRVLTLTCKVQQLDATPGVSSIALLEKLRTRISRQPATDRLNAVGISVVRSVGAVDATVVVDDRRHGVSVLDLILQALYTEVDPERIQTIESVGLVPNILPDP